MLWSLQLGSLLPSVVNTLVIHSINNNTSADLWMFGMDKFYKNVNLIKLTFTTELSVRAPMMSSFSAGSFLDSKQLDAARTDGLKNSSSSICWHFWSFVPLLHPADVRTDTRYTPPPTLLVNPNTCKIIVC